MTNNWIFEEDNWGKNFNWFLVDEGKIHYAFKSKFEAKIFKREFLLNYMFLTNLEKIIPETMIDPFEWRSWINKEQKCVYKKN